MKYTPEEIEALKTYVNQGEERVKSAKRIIAKNTIDFDTWYKYSIPEERFIYPSILGTNTAIGRMVHKKMAWLSFEEYYEMKLDVDFILESANHLLENYGEITSEDIDEIKREMVKLNFGSMVNKW